MRPVAVVGNLSRDIVDGEPPRVGGAPYYAGRALRLLGRPARILTKLAPEDRVVLLRPLAALGHRVAWRAAASTAAFTFSYEGDLRSMRVDAVGEPWTPDDASGWMEEALRGVRWLHVAPLARTDFSPETLRVLARGRRLSFDGQGLVRPGRTGALALDTEFDPAVLEHVSVLKLAEDEAVALLGGLNEDALAELRVPEVVVTCGSRGSLLWTGGRLTHVPVRALPHVDPTGAGDSYAAAYVASRSAGLAPIAAARRATATVVALLGGTRR